jgi:hypothetical protein
MLPQPMLAPVVAAALVAFEATTPVPDGRLPPFLDHGVAVPVSSPRGIVATTDAAGHGVVLVWLIDHTGGHALLHIDVDTGEVLQHAPPFDRRGEAPYASLLTRDRRFVTHFGGHLTVYDPDARAFTFTAPASPTSAMSFTEDRDGVVWAATWPDSGLVSFDPRTGTLVDHGPSSKEAWKQYPRSIVVDDVGHIFLGVGSAEARILVRDVTTGAVTNLLADRPPLAGGVKLMHREDDAVFALVTATTGQQQWYRVGVDAAVPIDKPTSLRLRPMVAGTQDLVHRAFGDGRTLVSCDTVAGVLVVRDPAGERRVPFAYASEGAHVMSLAVDDDGVVGATTFPMRRFRWSAEGRRLHDEAPGQWNVIAVDGHRLVAGAYPGGSVVRQDLDDGAPEVIGAGSPNVHRPHDVVVIDGRVAIVGGTPAYGLTGGGLVFADLVAGTVETVRHVDVVPERSTLSLAPVPGKRVLGGTTTAAGTGGVRASGEAGLYELDVATRVITPRGVPVPGALAITDLLHDDVSGYVYGTADLTTFFVWHEPTGAVVVTRDLRDLGLGPAISPQGPGAFTRTPDGDVLLVLQRGVVRVDARTFELAVVATSPVLLTVVGGVVDGRLVVAGGSHLYSLAIE